MIAPQLSLGVRRTILSITALQEPMEKVLETETEVARTIIGMERAALDRWGRGDPSGFLEIAAADVVYFDPYQPRRLNGIDELRALYESIRGKVSIARFELIDPRVQVVADMAVLTFNYVAEGSNEVTSRWNCTEVYRRQADTWRIIQTHWSFTQPVGKTQ
jgi:ketosteroid isomerase-like protein